MAVPRIPPAVAVVVTVLAVAGTAVGFTGCSDTGPSPNAASSSSSPPTTTERTTAAPTPRPGESEGAFVFRTRCAGCHGPKGEGNLGPSLVGVADRMTVADEATLVRDGRERMPPLATGLTNAQIQAVVAYTRTQLG